jgi:DUF4097 and DUF4098 domain-containing protein YvlB
MSLRSLITSAEPIVLVDAVYGNLQVEGWERAEIQLQSNSDETAALRQDGEAYRVKTTSDCLLHLPYQASLTVTSVHGGARIKLVHKPVTAGRVLGSLAVDDTGAIHAESVYGEIIARGVAGDLTIDQVLGNAWIEDVKGNCSLDRVAGDLEMQNIGGDVRASASGDAHIRLDSLGGMSYKIEASGDIAFNVPEAINAKIQISCRGNNITLDLPDGQRRLETRSHELTLGNGNASILLKASGSVSLRCGEGSTSGAQETDQAFARIAEDFSQKISGDIDTQMKILDEQMEHLSESISRVGMASVETDRIMRRARESSERANVRAQQKMQRAREKLDRKLAAAQRKVEENERESGQQRESQNKKTWSFEWPTPASPAQREPEVSDEERLMILRMLEQKKISLAEAEQLLEALEGKSG